LGVAEDRAKGVNGVGKIHSSGLGGPHTKKKVLQGATDWGGSKKTWSKKKLTKLVTRQFEVCRGTKNSKKQQSFSKRFPSMHGGIVYKGWGKKTTPGENPIPPVLLHCLSRGLKGHSTDPKKQGVGKKRVTHFKGEKTKRGKKQGAQREKL